LADSLISTRERRDHEVGREMEHYDLRTTGPNLEHCGDFQQAPTRA
jgi:hypothetical protein